MKGSALWGILLVASVTPLCAAKSLVSIQVTPATASVPAGLKQQFTATGTYSDGSGANITTSVTWSTSNTTFATISNYGVATGKTPGSVQVYAVSGSIKGNATLQVTAPVLISIAVSPSRASITTGKTRQFTATGTYSDKSTATITTAVSWSSSVASIATISSTGLAQGVAAGSTTITAASGSIQGTSTLSVTTPSLTSITVTPANPSVALGRTVQFVATGHYSDATTKDLTSSVSWKSANTAVATINAVGLATSVGQGTSTISASAGSITGKTTLTVTPAVLASIAVTPPNLSLPLGTTQQFTATGTFTDGSTQNLTATAVWSSSAPGVAVISASGLASSVAVGSTTVTASSGSVSGQAVLTVSPAALVSLSVTPASASFPLGATQQFAATGTFTDGSTQSLTAVVTWSSSAPGVATVTAGLATGTGTGTVSIKATAGSIESNSASVTVLPAVLQSIAVTPANASIALGTTQQFAATGTFTDGSTQNITASVNWSSSYSAIATITSAGLATGVAIGGTTILATSGSVTGSTPLTVSSAQLVSIAVTPAIPSIPLGTTQQFRATGTFTDSTTQDLTAAVHWSSSDASLATISNSAGTNGLASSLAPGSTTITASSDPVSGSTTLTMTPAALVSISITPADPSIVLGTGQQFTAIGTYTDSTTQDLTSTATWSSSSTTVATISATGLADSAATGTTTIAASLGNVSGTTTLTVSPAALASIIVSPSTASIPLGTSQQFTATGNYADGSTQDLTSSVHWSSSDGTVATVSNAAGTTGLAASGAIGSVIISATSGTMSGTASLTITPASLVSVSVAPLNPSIPLGRSEQFAATGAYTDDSTKDITTNVIWSSSTATVAVISNNIGSQGLATSSGVGVTTIGAAMGSVAASTTLTVGTPQLVSVAVTPANPTLPLGTSQQFTATGTYTDSSTADLTNSVAWSSSNWAVAIITASGLATSASPGATTIVAASGGISGTATLTVTPPVIVGIQVSPPSPIVGVGATQQFTATALYSDSSTRDVTQSVAWLTSNTAVATISASGLLTGIAAGSANITAQYGGLTSSPVIVTVLPLVAAPTFNPGAGTYSSAQSVTISTTPGGCGSYIYWNTTGNPGTGDNHGTSVTVATSETVYGRVINCPGYADSAVGSATYAIQMLATPAYAGNGASCPNTYTNGTSIGTYNCRLPNPTGSGNLLVVFVTSDNSGSVAGASLTDNVNTSVGGYTKIAQCTDSTNAKTSWLYYRQNIQAGINYVQLNGWTNDSGGNAGGRQYVQVAAYEFYNVDPTAALDANMVSCRVASGTSIQPSTTTMTPGSAANELVVQAAMATTSFAWTGTTPGFTAGTNWALRAAMLAFTQNGGNGTACASNCSLPYAMQYRVKPDQSAENPTLIASQSINYMSISAGFKPSTGSQGTAPSTGIRVRHVQHDNTLNESDTTTYLQEPNDGNLLAVGYVSYADNYISTSTMPTDTVGSTWHYAIGDTTGWGSSSQIYYAGGLSPSNSRLVRYTLTASKSGAHGRTFMTYDISGANAATPFDKGYTNHGDDTTSSCTGPGTGPNCHLPIFSTGASGCVPSGSDCRITPSAAGELVLVAGGIAWDSAIGWVSGSPTNGRFISAYPTTDVNPSWCDENNIAGMLYTSDTSPETWDFLQDWLNARAIGSWSAAAAVFKP